MKWRKYYDLGVKGKQCPKCNGQKKEKAAESNKAKAEPSAPITDVEFFEVLESGNGEVRSISRGFININLPTPREGWHVTASDILDRDKLSNEGAVVYLGDFPFRGLSRFLSTGRFKGFGSVTAQRMSEQHGAALLEALKSGTKLTETPFLLSEKDSSSLHNGWQKSPKENLLYIFLAELGLSEAQSRAALGRLGADVISSLNLNPFSILKSIPRLSFQDVEQICGRLHIMLTKQQRIIAATDYYLNDAEQKHRHTCVPDNNTHQRVGELLNLPINDIADALKSDDDAFVFSDRKSRTVISTRISDLRDRKIIKELEAIQSGHRPLGKGLKFGEKDIRTSKGIQLSKEQLDAINVVVNASIAVITGGPGSGKTTMVQGLVSALLGLNANIRICAPTGRAAKRISETPGLADLEPSTIHMFLAKLRSSKNDNKFDVMIVDEASMIDVDLMSELLESIPRGASVVFIGDVDQLPPVGPGQPFKDIIESEAVPVARLTGNFRQSSFSDTVKAARSVIRGNTPDISASLATTDFAFFECPPIRQADLILDLYFDQLPAKLEVPPQDIQIISPQRPGDVGVLRLNDLVQNRLIGRTKPLFTKKSGTHDVTFYIGDKVIQRKNNYELKVMNGDQGTILRESGQHLMVDFDGQEIAFDGLQRYDLDLAYATTIHSSQGSEYPGVIMPITAAHGHMLSRNLIYTAITRGKKQVCIVGEVAALEKHLRNFQRIFVGLRLLESSMKHFKPSINAA